MTEHDIDEYVTLTEELLAGAVTPTGGYTKDQLAVVGVSWPPIKGWKQRLVGKRISRAELKVLISE